MNVSDKDVSQAYENFNELYFPNQHGVGLYFWAFLGMKKAPVLARVPTGGWELPEAAAHAIHLLKGPHYKTVAQIMLINGHQYKVPIDA
jgi:hypothetical protein